MPKVRVNCVSVSLDGFSAGPNQDLNNPAGVGGFALFQWFFPTRAFQQMHGKGVGETGIDNDWAEKGMAGIGAWILGRNMFGPVRGPWPDENWKGWWGDNPVYHVPVFVLTHHPRQSITMAGGTTFHFVTEGIQVALQRAKEAAGDLDVRIGGGPATIRQYLKAQLIDSMHLAISPALLGAGEKLLDGINLPDLGYQVASHAVSASVMHVVIAKNPKT